MRLSTMKSGTVQFCCAALAAFVLGACDGGPNVDGGAQPVATQDTGATAPHVAHEADTAELADNGSAAVCAAQEQLELYDRRIKPLGDGAQPSSCNQCHVSDVDLAMFVQESPREPIACLAKLRTRVTSQTYANGTRPPLETQLTAPEVVGTACLLPLSAC